MAVNVDAVYKTVLTIQNKESRGLLTPAQFNRLGEQAQLALLEKSFYDYSRMRNRQNRVLINDQYADLAKKVQEKIDYMSKSATQAVTSGEVTIPADNYRIIQVVSDDRTIEYEEVTKKEATYLNSSILSAPDTTFPMYYQEGAILKVLPASINGIDVIVDYIRKPAAPVWAFTGGGTVSYSYDAGSSVDFSLHPSEQTDLIIKILAYCGIVVEDAMVVENARYEEADTFNKENTQ